MELKNAQLHYVKIYYSEFHLSTLVKKESESRMSLTSLSKMQVSPNRFLHNSGLFDNF